MDVKLKVLGGAKSGLEIPLKKELFTIGRSAECSLRAGSDAISRRHCAIRMNASGIRITDLNSRNGTYVNGQRIDEETSLANGDEVRVGPLKFVVVAEQLAVAKRPSGGATDARRAAGATVNAGKEPSFEENIDGWLTLPASDSQVTRETTSLRLDETQGGQVPAAAKEPAPTAEVAEAAEMEDSPMDSKAGAAASSDALAGDAAETEEGSSVRKRKDKKEPGKLPTRPKGPTTKDSREAAAEVLRAMTRRR
jgi:pSer/pThr/pTyr-binding forkhead associated (FHA) protein